MIDINDSLKIIKNFNISIEDIDLLMNLYRPVTGIDSLKVYLILAYSKDADTLSLILKENDLDVYEFNRYKQSLEEVELIRTFESVNESDLYKFIIDLHRPDGSKMLNNHLFVNKLAERVSKDRFEELYSKYKDNDVIPKGYKDVSSLSYGINEKEKLKLNNYIEPKTSTFVKSSVYDTKLLLSDPNIRNSSLYPLISNPDNLKRITKILEIAGLSPETFRTKVLINFIGKDEIDFDKMKLLSLKCKLTLNFDSRKGYLNPCAVFLKKLYGFEPEFYDKKLADMIYTKYEFPIDVINYLLEFCLINNDKKINTNYLGRICTTVKLKNLTTIDELKQHLNPKKGVEFKRVEDNETSSLNIDSKAIDKELADILNKR